MIINGIDKEAKRNRIKWQFCISRMAIQAMVANNLSPREQGSFGKTF